ncbi:hypothetical protein [Daejeonella sp.]|uniref:hypothetical protein n=1 Tax=Daejeonella sp. TaxID=2805397 RepID=UPI003983B27D
MKKSVTLISFLLVFVVVCLAADLTGTYKGSVIFQERKLDLTFKLKAEGEKLTGSINSEYGEIPLLDGQINGQDFTYKIDIGNGPMESKGKFMTDSIEITSNFGGTEVKNMFKRIAE